MTTMSPARAVPLGLLALIVALLVALTGCGGDANDEAPSAAGAGAQATGDPVKVGEEVTGKPIVIGSICSCTGPVSSSSGAVPATLQAWVKWTNTHGGINGHPVKIVQMDDGLDAAKTVKQVKELVEKHHVMAIVGEVSNLSNLWAEYVEKRGIPVVGAGVFNTTYESNPTFFPTGAQNPTQVYGAVKAIQQLGKSKIALMPCAESPSCQNYVALFKAVAQQLGGVSVVSSQRITSDAPNYTAACLSARQSGADVLAVLAAPSVVTRVTANCSQQGYKPAGVNLSFVPGPDWAKDPNLQGMVTITPNQSLWDTSIPPNKEFSDALDTFAEGIKDRPEYNPADASAWAAAQVFKLAAERADIGPDSTPADVKRGLWTFEDETLGGLTPPLTFTKGDPPPLVACNYVSKIEKQTWVAPDGAKPTCVAPKDMERVRSLLARG